MAGQHVLCNTSLRRQSVAAGCVARVCNACVGRSTAYVRAVATRPCIRDGGRCVPMMPVVLQSTTAKLRHLDAAKKHGAGTLGTCRLASAGRYHRRMR